MSDAQDKTPDELAAAYGAGLLKLFRHHATMGARINQLTADVAALCEGAERDLGVPVVDISNPLKDTPPCDHIRVEFTVEHYIVNHSENDLDVSRHDVFVAAQREAKAAGDA